MTEFILHHADVSIGLTFNEVATRLKERKDVTVLESDSIDGRDMGMIVIEASKEVALSMRGTFPGWTVSPNYTIGPL